MEKLLIFLLFAALAWVVPELIILNKKVAALSEAHGALWKMYKDASGLIDAHTELEREAAESERRFQEGLNNILSYGVKIDG